MKTISTLRLILQPSITETLLRNIKGRVGSRLDDEFAEPLTERERGVIRLMAGGPGKKSSRVDVPLLIASAPLPGRSGTP